MVNLFDIYIAGPMGGYPDLNEETFRAVEKYTVDRLRLKALIPHDIPPYMHDGPCPDGFRRNEDSEHSECCYARNDIVYMLRDCLSVIVLPKWQPSVGSRLEVTVAAQTGMPMRFLDSKQVSNVIINYAHHNHIFGPPEGLIKARFQKGLKLG